MVINRLIISCETFLKPKQTCFAWILTALHISLYFHSKHWHEKPCGLYKKRFLGHRTLDGKEGKANQTQSTSYMRRLHLSELCFAYEDATLFADRNMTLWITCWSALIIMTDLALGRVMLSIRRKVSDGISRKPDFGKSMVSTTQYSLSIYV